MENQEKVINELNGFLKGRYMGIHQLENLIYVVEDQSIKNILQDLQQTYKQHAILVAERIQNLGGKPKDGVGFTGTMAEWMSSLKGYPDGNKNILELVKNREAIYGIEYSEEIVKGDLDEESKQLIESIIDEDRQIKERLQTIMETY
ncbi:DUF2383 domain-containing protein [Bacillus kwashiorkori]|uniref:DUF2383 domain-containing protein n=1 Tax=Bacillus kwashiorkori TaxID=1522318 RepID=UPI0007816776|nr:DUF2383 domain-containing protein [Bacillus kwashiorkori]